MQDTIIDVRRRTQELTISEIVSREIDPVLFILLLTHTTDKFPISLLSIAQRKTRKIVTCLTQLVTSWSNLVSASHPSQSLRSL